MRVKFLQSVEVLWKWKKYTAFISQETNFYYIVLDKMTMNIIPVHEDEINAAWFRKGWLYFGKEKNTYTDRRGDVWDI